MMDRDTITLTGARAPGVERHEPLERWCISASRFPDSEPGYNDTDSEVREGRMQTARCEELVVDRKARLIYRP